MPLRPREINDSPSKDAIESLIRTAVKREIRRLNASITVLDHGGLTGLGDDDHTQYALADKSRPSPWVAAGDLASLSIADLGTIDHDLLDGLGDDDHLQYLLIDGTRAMTGDLDMDGSDIILDVDGDSKIDVTGDDLYSFTAGGTVIISISTSTLQLGQTASNRILIDSANFNFRGSGGILMTDGGNVTLNGGSFRLVSTGVMAIREVAGVMRFRTGSTTRLELSDTSLTGTGVIFDSAGSTIQSGGGNIDSEGGDILAGTGTIDSEGGIIRSGTGTIDSEGGIIQSGTGTIDSEGGIIDSNGGIIRSGSGLIDSEGGIIDSDSGIIRSGGGVIDSEGGIIQSGGADIDTEGGDLDLGGGDVIFASGYSISHDTVNFGFNFTALGINIARIDLNEIRTILTGCTFGGNGDNKYELNAAGTTLMDTTGGGTVVRFTIAGSAGGQFELNGGRPTFTAPLTIGGVDLVLKGGNTSGAGTGGDLELAGGTGGTNNGDVNLMDGLAGTIVAHVDAPNSVFIVDTRLDINNGIALGGGAAPTLGTIGGSGPGTAAQAQWVEIDIGGTPHWIAVWV